MTEIGVESKKYRKHILFTAVFGVEEGMIKPIENTHKKLIQDENTKNGTILLAEDDLVSRNMVTIILKKNGFKVIAVENGKEAVTAFEKGQFDLILMDINMSYFGWVCGY